MAMRLLQRKSDDEFTLTEHPNDSIPPYAILSHTWGGDGDEVSFKDLMEGTGKNKAGYEKIRFCGTQATRDGLNYFWVDTCCIDKSSSAELSEAITSMFRWYSRAEKCYVYLSDVLVPAGGINGSDQVPWKGNFLQSKWFTRGWTLQELLAPASVEFFSREGERLGDKKSLETEVHSITGIDIRALQGSPLSCFTIDERMSWAKQRETKREEDGVHCLLGIFDIYLPLLYGIGKKKAFARFWEEIDKPIMDELLDLTSAPNKIGLSVLADPVQPALDIVFVHGFTGHPEYTWSQKQEDSRSLNGHNDEDNERPSKRQKFLPSAPPDEDGDSVCQSLYWLRDLIPTAVPNARVLTYGYNTSLHHDGNSMTEDSAVDDVVWNFLLSLELARRVHSCRPLLLIAHSIGGIVVKEALRRSSGCKKHQSHLRSIYEGTSGMIFFGTPHGGPNSPELVRHTIDQVSKIDDFELNNRIVDTFLLYEEELKEWGDKFNVMARDRGWTIFCFQEQYGNIALGGKKVLEDTVSRLNDPTIEFAQYIASNHMEMCRFSGHDDADYKKVVTAINRIIKVNIESVHSGSFSTVEENQRQRFLDRLKFDQIEARHATIKAAHAKTCKWLLNKSEYKEWLDDTKNFEHHGFLWLKGKPGTGKSTMMKFAYANAKKCMPDTIVISFFFNARGDDLEKSALGMYRSLLFQLLEKLPDIQNPFELLEPNLPNDFDTDIETAKSVFSRMVDRLGENRLACFIDALDECEEDQARDMVAFFESLGQYAISSHIQMHICFSSRHYPYITIEKGISLVLEDQDGHSKDITDYLHSELKARQNKAMQKVQDEILQRASGVFLWVVLVVKMLNKEFDRGRMHALQKRLDEIPSDLDALFRDILTRDTENVEDLILCLQWILYARRPMKPEELYFAILAGVAAEELAPWNSDELTEQDIQRYILSSSKGLAEMTKSKHPTVQFIHESVRDFLLKGNGLDSLRSHLNKNFPGSSHERLKECCQTYAEVDISEYLSSDTKQPVPSSKEADRTRLLVSAKFPFLEYAVHNVLHHAETADECGISQTYFVHNFPLRDWIHLDNLFEKYQVRRHTPNCSMLYILSEKSLHNLIRIELKRIQNLDIQGERFGFPLHVALANKSEAALRALLLPDTSRWPTDKTSFNCSPSTTNESQNCINLLLEMGNEISSQPDQSVLSWAAKGGHEAIVKLLLDTSKIDIDSKDKAGRTPLLWAAAGGHETIVDLLLKTGEVDVDWRDKAGRTPASWAAAGGYEAVIKLLLGTGKVDVKSEDTAGQTLLLWAAAGGHEIIVRLLLDTGNVDFESKDKSGRTLLSWAAAGGHEVIVKMLLKTGKVNIGSKDKAGWTPASWAAAGRHKAIVKLLLDAREESKIVSQSDRNQPPHLTP